ncbi:MAG: PEP-CTERM sorting domain-containing protein [Verrucomicrobia bacterium]|nr:PEP-CTERM sorting domain-containing protein [Verrucomicrobiota bacterium]
MKTLTLVSVAITSVLSVSSTVHANFIETMFLGDIGANGDRLSRAANWSNGLPLISEGKEGIISVESWGPTTTSARLNDIVSGQRITQLSGRVYADSNRNFTGGTVWNLRGGEMDWGNFTLNTAANDGYTLNMSGGTFNAARINVYEQSVLNLSGGVMTVDRAVWQGGVINFLEGNAIVSVTGVAADQFQTSPSTIINFSPLAMGSLTIASLNEAGFISLWDANRLRFDGGNVGAFADHFVVTGSTLSVIPEPSTYAMLFGLAVLGVVLVRRRRA